jgi:hypothetical protein
MWHLPGKDSVSKTWFSQRINELKSMLGLTNEEVMHMMRYTGCAILYAMGCASWASVLYSPEKEFVVIHNLLACWHLTHMHK